MIFSRMPNSPFSLDPAGAVSPLSPQSVPEGVQLVWEGNEPEFIVGGKVAVYVGTTIGRAEPRDLPVVVYFEIQSRLPGLSL